MLRTFLLIFHLIEIALYTFAFQAMGGGSPVEWLITVACMALSLRAVLTLTSMLIAKVPAKPLSLTFAAFASEYYSVLRTYSVDAFLTPPRLIVPAVVQTRHLPILFIHGYMCNAGYWRRFLAVLKPVWGNTIATISLEPLHASIDHYSAQIDACVDELLESSSQSQCLIVAHSMGGLATRSYFRNLNAHNKVKAVVTLGTPHSGTMLAHLDFSKNAHQMRKLSNWLETLRAAESADNLPHFDSVIGTHDNIVAPQNCAEFDLADNTYVTGMTHLAMAYNRPLIDWTIERLKHHVGAASSRD